MQYISAEELRTKSGDEQWLLVDVREEYEFEDHQIGGINIPMGEILDRLDEITHATHLIFCCKSGKRSLAVAYQVEKRTGHPSVYSLSGGIEEFLATTQS